MRDLFHQLQKPEQLCLIFYHEKYEQLLYHELIDACVKEYMKININTNEVQLIEKKTREQSKSEL